MSQIQDAQSFLDTIKERFSNPVLFTYMWVWSLYNWKPIGWFLSEPLKFSLKIQQYESLGFSFHFFWPILITSVVMLFMPLLIHIVDFIDRAWSYGYTRLLRFLKWKDFVEASEFIELQEELKVEKSLHSDAYGKLETVINEKKELKGKLQQSELELAKLKEELNSVTQSKAKYQMEMNNLHEKYKHLENQNSQYKNVQDGIKAELNDIDLEKLTPGQRVRIVSNLKRIFRRVDAERFEV